MTTRFQVSALPSSDLQRIRARGTDDFGNAIVGQADSDADGVPLRCCLREAAAGERFALIAWQPADVGGPYAEVGPVFIHVDSCPGYSAVDDYPEGFRHRRQLFRAYDAEGRQVNNQIVEGRDAELAIARLFARTDVSFVHSRNVLAGCYMSPSPGRKLPPDLGGRGSRAAGTEEKDVYPSHRVHVAGVRRTAKPR